MSSLIESASRAALLQMARAPLAYGRRLLSANALSELARRAVDNRIQSRCSVSRCMRVEKLIMGRRQQVLGLLEIFSPLEPPKSYTGVLDVFTQLQSMAQAASAAAAIDSTIRGDSNVL